MQIFVGAAGATVNTIILNKLNFSLDKLISLIKEVYQYAIKTNPPSIDNRFVDWLIDKYKD